MVERIILTPVQKFIKAESFSGFILFLATVLALIIANSPVKDWYHNLWQFEIGLKSDTFKLIKPLSLWINDGFMAIFFFLIGLEIKREIMLGELNSLKKASLPIVAAVGGMVFPVGIFFLLNNDPQASNAWGISMATDIAFSLAVLTLLGKRIPLGLKIFLTAFAIIDDIGAVLVIAFFYTEGIVWSLLGYAAILLSILYYMAYKKIHNKYLIVIFGIIIWVLFLKSGIHPTIAGILLAFAVPIRQSINEYEYAKKLKEIVNRITEEKNTNDLPVLTHNQIDAIDNLEDWTYRVQSPVQQLEHRLHKWVAFFIMPLFAFANAGVTFGAGMDLNTALVINITLALFVGKFLGVSLLSYLGVKFKLFELPQGVTFSMIIGVALLAGLGFTMSLFIGNLAFSNNALYLDSSKVGIILGSLTAGVLGYLMLRFGLKKKD